MVFSYLLRVEFDWCSPYHGVSELPDHSPVNSITKVLDCWPIPGDDNRGIIVRIFSFGFGIDSNQVQILPHPIDKLIQIPSKMTSNGDIMINLIQNIQFLKSNSINFVQCIQARNIFSIALYHINYIIFCCITFYQ